MDALQRAMVSLLISDDQLDPEEITNLLRAQPRLGVRMGEVFTGHDGRAITARSGMWNFGSDWEGAPNVSDRIVSLFSQLTQDLDSWKSVTNRFQCYVSVGGYFNDWTGGLTLESHVLKILAERGLAIDFDLYAPSASDPEEMS